MRLCRLRLTYWPVWFTSSGKPRPVLALHRTPDPHCPSCEGCGYVGQDPEGIDETECECAPFAPVIALPLPLIANCHYRRRLIRPLERHTANNTRP